MTSGKLDMPESALVDDFAIIQAKLTSPELKELQTNILAGAATDKDIELHYRAFDAIDAPTAFKSEKAAYLHIRSMGRVALADFIGGAQILSSTLMSGALKSHGGFDGILPTLFTEQSAALVYSQLEKGEIKERDLDNWDTIVDYTATTKNLPIKNLAERVGLLHSARLAGFLDSDVKVTNISDLKALSLGKAIISEGSKGFRHYIDIQRSAFLRTESDAFAAERIINISEEPELGLGISNLILRSANILSETEAKDIYLKEMKNVLAPMLSWPTTERAVTKIRYMGTYHELDVSMLQDIQQNCFVDALNNLTTLTNFARDTNPDMFKKGRIKGSLHEVLWMLDAYVLRKGMPKQFGAYVVSASSEAEDMPHIGKPKSKRGFDFVIQPRLNSPTRRLIQVGASNQKEKNQAERPYHPGIEVYCEEPFNEVNLTTLEKKLALYSKWANDGLKEADYARLKIHGQLLGSIKKCFDV